MIHTSYLGIQIAQKFFFGDFSYFEDLEEKIQSYKLA